MRPADFAREFAEFERASDSVTIKQLTERREANAQAAIRVGRLVGGYDRAGYWPHLHTSHDELVVPMRLGKWAGFVLGTVFTKLVVDQFITDPTLVVQLTAIGTFIAFSQAAETAYCARAPLPERLKHGARSVWNIARVAFVPIAAWLLMRVPETPIAALAETWEGVALIWAELMLFLLSASAGAAERAYRWSREFYQIEVEIREQLVALGAETAATPYVLPAISPASIVKE